MDPTLLGRPVPVPTAQKPGGLVTKKTLLLILGGAAAVIAGALMLLANQDNSITLQPRLSARQATTLKIIADGQKNITDDELRKLNSELNITLSSDDSALQAALKSAGMKKPSKEVTAAEADTATFEALKNAKLNGQYNQKYRTLLTTKLEALLALLKEVHGGSKDKALKAILATEYEHLATYLKDLDALAN